MVIADAFLSKPLRYNEPFFPHPFKIYKTALHLTLLFAAY